jgi:hypothetical protein
MEGETTEPPVETAPVIGSIEMDEKVLTPAIAQMSPLYRLRWLVPLWGTFFVVFMALGTSPRTMAVPMAFTVVVLALLLITPRLTARRLVEAIARGGDRHVSYRFDDEGITIRAAGATTTFAYRKLVRVREIKTALLLYTTHQIANIIPKRAFSDSDLARVRAFLAPYTKAQKRGATVKLVVLWLALVVAFLVLFQLVLAPSRG